jgi:hypothetical protein
MRVTDRMRGDETEDILEALDLLDHVALAVQQITLVTVLGYYFDCGAHPL